MGTQHRDSVTWGAICTQTTKKASPLDGARYLYGNGCLERIWMRLNVEDNVFVLEGWKEIVSLVMKGSCDNVVMMRIMLCQVVLPLNRGPASMGIPENILHAEIAKGGFSEEGRVGRRL